ncbi:MAG TPA: 5'-nucleotidase C-terminal domain-containing protein [Kofleriaceae bacterium]|nr:5'-nucleotidase C-terminal domain-containing protein [Kofleriaceae bacterium]
MKSLVVCLVLVAACSQPATKHVDHGPPVAKKGARTLTIIGTNDLHGAIDRLPLLAGFINNVRAAREADGGGVLLVDAGDMFQGTLESNLAEGEDVVRAYNAIGYTAAAVGNHEFDFGPEGPSVVAKSVEEDPRGALKARAAEAKFPFLVSNINDQKSGNRIKWPNMPSSILVEVAGTMVGVIGAATESTPFTTMPANFTGLVMAPTAQAIAKEAEALRARGAQVIVVVAHIGSACKDVEKPNDLSSCKTDEEVFKVISDLPKGLVDVWVGGHTHATVAHRIKDVAVIESYSSGRAFGRVDLRITDTHVSAVQIHKPQLLCPLDSEGNPPPAADCHPEAYEGKPVVPDADVQKIADEASAKAAPRRDEKLGVQLTAIVTKSYSLESAEGNWFTDLMLAARPDAQLALTNGGGLRADIPAGELTYGRLYEAMPFDNRFAIVEMKGKHVRRLVTTNIQRGSGIYSWGGLVAKARCKSGQLDVEIKVAGKPIADEASYKVVTSDFLASGGDMSVIGRLKLPEGAIQMTDVIIRDAIADVLRKKKGKLDPATLYSPAKRRLDYEGERPVECGGKQQKQQQEPD